MPFLDHHDAAAGGERRDHRHYGSEDAFNGLPTNRWKDQRKGFGEFYYFYPYISLFQSYFSDDGDHKRGGRDMRFDYHHPQQEAEHGRGFRKDHSRGQQSAYRGHGFQDQPQGFGGFGELLSLLVLYVALIQISN